MLGWRRGPPIHWVAQKPLLRRLQVRELVTQGGLGQPGVVVEMTVEDSAAMMARLSKLREATELRTLFWLDAHTGTCILNRVAGHFIRGWMLRELYSTHMKALECICALELRTVL